MLKNLSDLPTVTPDAIKELRQKIGATQQQLASWLNVGVATVSRWERGLEKPSGTAAAILQTLVGAIVFRISPAALFLTSGFGIYKLLKKVLDNGEEAKK